MKLLMVAPEIVPLAKTGGLGDVAGALSLALARLGVEVTMVLPAYQTILESGVALERTGLEVGATLGERRVKGEVRTMRVGGSPVFLIRADRYFLRPQLYGTPQGDYPDNVERFAFFCKAALDLAQKTAPWDVIHCHDWQTALIPVLQKIRADLWPAMRNSKTLLTIHNLAYQGTFPLSSWPLLDIDMQYFTPRHLEFYGEVNWLKSGILFADAMTTVSRKYAMEIMEPEFGCGLEGVIRGCRERLYGILNGADYAEWNPATDAYLKKHYTATELRGKESCKKELQEIYKLPVEARVPVMGIVSRLAQQKGLDIIAEAVEKLMGLELQLVVLGTGEQKYHDFLTSLAVRYPKKIGVRIGFDNALAHKIEAGADMFLMPSKYEPCGLNQIYSLAYGTIPIVRATGGLDDTIEDYDPATGAGNGFKFSAYSGAALVAAVKRALSAYAQKTTWQRLIANAMACEFSWDRSAKEYLALYRKLTQG